MSKPRRSLPPGVNDIDGDITFGTLWIKIGTLKLIRTSNAQYNVLCQFWGEPTPVILATRSDTPNNEQMRTQKYDIKCPITIFVEYLEEMRNNLRLEVEGVGKVTFDITKFMKKNVNIDNKQPFDHFKGFFEIIGKGNRKAGSIQIEMGCQFDPQIAIRELGQEAIQQIRESEILKCPAQKLQVKSCCGHCVCICPKPPVRQKNLFVQQVKNDDPRIPHSLDTKPRNQTEFDPHKYQSNQVIVPTKDNNRNKPDNVIQRMHQQQTARGREQENEEFPQVPKILTYSNLKLNYQDPQLQVQLHKNPYQSQLKYQEPTPQRSEIQNKYITYNMRQNVQIPINEIKPKPQISKEDLMKQFYGAENSPYKSNIEDFNDKSRSQASEPLKSQRQKLSKVINLDKELERSSRAVIDAPPVLISKIPDSPHFSRSQFHKNNVQMVMPMARTKKSDLILSLFVQIDKNSIRLPGKQGYIIAYRPYGQKERVTLGPNFIKNIEIISLVGENQVRKMGKTPFILQFWGSVSNKFIGLIRLDLSKIKNGFLLQNRLNETAIKTNILPTTIQRGEIKILDLTDQQVGLCSIYASIATSNQLNTYLNQKDQLTLPPSIPKTTREQVHKPERIQDPEKQAEPYKKPDQNIDNKNILSSFDTFLDQLYKNNSLIIDTLNLLMNQRQLSRNQLNQLSKMIGISSLNNIYDLHQQISEKKDVIDFHRIAQSFDDFIQMVQQIKNDLGLCSKTLRNIFTNPSAILTEIKQQTPMKVISKKKLSQIMLKYSKYDHPIHEYLNKFIQYINLQYIQSTLLGKPLVLPELVQINKDYMNQIISERICTGLVKNGFTLDKFKQKFEDSENISIVQLFKWLIVSGINVNLWGLMHWIEMINLSNNVNDVLSTNKLHFISNYLILCEKISGKQVKHEDIHQQIQERNKNKKEDSKKEIIPTPQPQIMKPIPPPPNLPQQQVAQPIHNEDQRGISAQQQQNQSQSSPKKQQKSFSQQPQPQQKFYKHLFSIQPTQLSLDNPIKGNCEVVYIFPFDEQQIKSKNFMLSVDKHKYPLKMYGTHGFTIQQNAEDYLGENSIKFYVKIDNRIEYEGALPSDELLIEPNTDQNKIIPLFSERNEGIAGKIKMNISYQKIQATQNALGKQTTYQLYLPKSGYINYSISSQLQPTKIRSQLNIRQEFYIALVLDLFYHNANLKQMFPPVSSKLYSDSTQIAQISGSTKISLSPVILEYLKTNSARLSLNIIYYSKQSGNFQRKQVPYAIIELPLMSVIKSQGIKGDYAFKNKLGMFVTLANCQMKYEKDSIVKAISKQQPEKHTVSYWLILNFLEFINFEMSKFTWIRMEFVLKGRKYSTEKIPLEQYSINPLMNASILIKFNQQDFVDTKIIPITISTNLSQKFAIDISLKGIMRDTVYKKYSINNQYYIIVNQSSKSTKMRLAVKSYCFKGGPIISNFVNILHQHLGVQIFDQMQLPQQIQNYEEMLNIFKNKLKLSSKNLQEILTELDPNKTKEKLNFEFFTNRTYYKLDFTPILAQSEDDIDFICQELPTQTNKQQILEYLTNNKIKLQNFRPQFLNRFCFRQLNKLKTDKNIEFLGIDNQIDLISFVRKIKILSKKQYEESYINSQINVEQKQRVVEISILEGSNFNLLYNGIKPNAIIRIPEFGIQTHISHRNSNPYFNEQFWIACDKENILILRNLKIEVYHCTSEDQDAENILIGSGYAKINPSELTSSDKIFKVVINSAMFTKSKATINIKVGLKQGKKQSHKQLSYDTSQKIEDSAQVSRYGQIIHDLHQEMKYKNKLFESSDEDI